MNSAEDVRRGIDNQLRCALLTLPALKKKGVPEDNSFDNSSDPTRIERLKNPPYTLQLKFLSPSDKEPPVERVLLMDDSSPWKLLATYEFPFGTLFNDIFEMPRGYSLLDDGTVVDGSWAEDRLRQLMDDLIVGKERVDKLNTLLVFNMYGFTPESISTEKYPVPFHVDSLASVVFHTFYDWDDAYKSPPMIKRCMTCKKLFFPRNGNQDYCDFPNPDPRLEGATCREAKLTRATREESKRKTLHNKLKVIRRDYEERFGNKRRNDFDTDYYDEEERLESDPWKYTKLVDWVDEYKKKNINKNRKKASK